MDQLIAFLRTWYHIFIWANVCIWEKFTGQEVSCPKCWKCTMARWVTFSLVFGVFVWLTWPLVPMLVIWIPLILVVQFTYLVEAIIRFFT